MDYEEYILIKHVSSESACELANIQWNCQTYIINEAVNFLYNYIYQFSNGQLSTLSMPELLKYYINEYNINLKIELIQENELITVTQLLNKISKQLEFNKVKDNSSYVGKINFYLAQFEELSSKHKLTYKNFITYSDHIIRIIKSFLIPDGIKYKESLITRIYFDNVDKEIYGAFYGYYTTIFHKLHRDRNALFRLFKYETRRINSIDELVNCISSAISSPIMTYDLRETIEMIIQKHSGNLLYYGKWYKQWLKDNITSLVSKDSVKLDKLENLKENFLDKQTNASEKLGRIIFEYGITCADSFQDEIQENVNDDGAEFALLWIKVMLESTYFFVDQTNRVIFEKLGQQGMATISTSLFNTVIDLVAGKYLKSYSQEQVQNFQKEMFTNMNKAQEIYYNCKELYYEDDLSESVARNITRRGFVNQFTDVLCGIITGSTPSMDSVFNLKAHALVANLLGKNEIDELVKSLVDYFND